MEIFFIINDLTGSFSEIIGNCSQKQFTEHINPICHFHAIFRSAEFSSEPFDFRL